MKNFFLRLLLILFWLLLPIAILYWPKIQWRDFDKNSITVFTWGDILDPTVIKQFEETTGIKIHLNYYSSNEELIVKLKATRGEGYDLIVPSDYAVQMLIREKLLQSLDHTKLHFLPYLNPKLCGHFYDPDLEYSVPFAWELFGLGIDKSYFQNKPYDHSWRLIFDQNLIHYQIGMINDPIEAVCFAAFYLYGAPHLLSADEKEGVRKLLVEQHAWVSVYASFRADYLLATKNCPVVAASSSYIFRTMRGYPFVDFIIPKEGTFISIENLCIPKASLKKELIYRFMNYLYERHSVAAHFKTYQFLPTTTHAYDLMSLTPEMRNLLNDSDEKFDRYHFIREVIPEEDVCRIWADVKGFH